MSLIVDKINEIQNLYHLQGCKTTQIKAAQKELDLIFPDEFTEYVRAFGVISFYGTEWTGLNIEGELNVVEETMFKRNNDKYFPRNCFVLENIGMDGILTIVDSQGYVYSYQSGKKPTLICKSLIEYLEICINRNNQM